MAQCSIRHPSSLGTRLDTASVSSCLVEIGGELVGRGVKDDGQPWWVDIEQPPAEGVPVLPHIRVALCGAAIASSGDYRRYFEHGGFRYSHTIDPRLCAPVRHSLAAVTVVHEGCMYADAYSTALTVLGEKDGIECADRLGLGAAFFVREGASYTARYSQAFAAMLA